jgi:hypothetical protein
MLTRFLEIEQLLYQVVKDQKICQLNWPSVSQKEELKMIVEKKVIYMPEELVRHKTEMRKKCAVDFLLAYDLSDLLRTSMLDRNFITSIRT